MKKTNVMLETARQRSNIYGFLSLIYGSEAGRTLLQRIKEPEFFSELSDMGINFEDDFIQKPEDELLEELAVEYTRLFLGPGKHISPHESVHHKRDDGDWGTLWGADTVEIKKFIAASGLEYCSGFTGLPDHISVELEFMQKAVSREAQAREEDDNDGALYCLRIQKKFIDEHIMKWIPVFCDKVVAEAKLSFYKEMARLTKYFLEFEKDNIHKYFAEAGG